MTKEKIISQLESLIDNSKSYFDEREPRDDQIWRDDVKALEYAIKAVKVFDDKTVTM